MHSSTPTATSSSSTPADRRPLRFGPGRRGPGRPGEWRLVDDLATPIDAAGQMAADGALLDAVVAGGPPTLRLYRWRPPALTIGRFQPDDDVDVDACARLGVEVVRRPSGGKAILHGGDLTYAVAMPRPRGRDGTVDAVYRRIAAALIVGLADLGVEARIARSGPATGAACFTGQEGADLRIGDRKLCGSAQVQRDGALLQHGSILLDRLSFDETDVLGESARPGRDRLRASTVSLAELGVPSRPSTVAAALIRGFESTFTVRCRLLERTGHRPEPEVDGSLAG